MSKLRTAEGIDLPEEEAKADNFSDIFFRSVSTKGTGYDYPADESEVNTIVEAAHFAKVIVLKELLGLKKSRPPGPDEAPAKIL
ncbi:unnamed protein product [Dibothriocephalus latus]|uniref:Uncharacterized protein n=1 Tax=Dibothriocephalus latus TaxID=60516 RepID=A0A3P7MPI6_DIBLA|nr:unnamed protein product [Dibothriocephalus latus]